LVKYSLDGLTKHMAKSGFVLVHTKLVRDTVGRNRPSANCKLWAKYMLRQPAHSFGSCKNTGPHPFDDLTAGGRASIERDFAEAKALELDAELMSHKNWWMKTYDRASHSEPSSVWYTCLECMVTAKNNTADIKHKTTCSRFRPSIQPLDRPKTETRDNW